MIVAANRLFLANDDMTAAAPALCYPAPARNILRLHRSRYEQEGCGENRLWQWRLRDNHSLVSFEAAVK
jgi:hypothetical protein